MNKEATGIAWFGIIIILEIIYLYSIGIPMKTLLIAVGLIAGGAVLAYIFIVLTLQLIVDILESREKK